MGVLGVLGGALQRHWEYSGTGRENGKHLDLLGAMEGHMEGKLGALGGTGSTLGRQCRSQVVGALGCGMGATGGSRKGGGNVIGG